MKYSAIKNVILKGVIDVVNTETKEIICSLSLANYETDQQADEMAKKIASLLSDN